MAREFHSYTKGSVLKGPSVGVRDGKVTRVSGSHGGVLWGKVCFEDEEEQQFDCKPVQVFQGGSDLLPRFGPGENLSS